MNWLALSATHVTADPPTMLVSIDNKTSALASVLEAGHFAINYLPQGAADIVDLFSGKSPLRGADRFEAGRWSTLATGAPTYNGAIGVMDCALEEVIERHGVSIVLGRVVDFTADPEGAPIVADQRAGVGFVFEPGPQLRRLDVGHVARSVCPGARRVVGAAPAMLVVEGVAQRVEGFLPTGNRLDSGG